MRLDASPEDADSDDESEEDKDDDSSDGGESGKPTEQQRAAGVSSAIRAVTEAVGKLPASDKAQKLLALAEVLTSHATAAASHPTFAAAAQQSREALALVPGLADAQIQLAQTLLEQAKVVEEHPSPALNEVALLKDAAAQLRAAKGAPAALSVLGEVLLKLGNAVESDDEAAAFVQEGMECYLEAARLFPDNADLQKIVQAISAEGEDDEGEAAPDDE